MRQRMRDQRRERHYLVNKRTAQRSASLRYRRDVVLWEIVHRGALRIIAESKREAGDAER